MEIQKVRHLVRQRSFIRISLNYGDRLKDKGQWDKILSGVDHVKRSHPEVVDPVDFEAETHGQVRIIKVLCNFVDTPRQNPIDNEVVVLLQNRDHSK